MDKDFLNIMDNLDDKIDYLYHLGIDTSLNLIEKFGNVTHVIIARSIEEAATCAQIFAKYIYNIQNEEIHIDPLYKTERFHLYKICNLLILSGGVGMPSHLICLNEVTKLLAYAKVYKPIYFQFGPAGGIGIEPGAIIIANGVLNNKFEPYYSTIECGQEFSYHIHIDSDLIRNIHDFNHDDFNVIFGKIIGAFDFYDEQGRTDGFLPLSYSNDDRNNFLHHAQEQGVVGVNMEAIAFAGFCNQLKIKYAVINYIVANRFVSDRVLINKTDQTINMRNTALFLIKYILEYKI